MTQHYYIVFTSFSAHCRGNLNTHICFSFKIVFSSIFPTQTMPHEWSASACLKCCGHIPFHPSVRHLNVVGYLFIIYLFSLRCHINTWFLQINLPLQYLDEHYLGSSHILHRFSTFPVNTLLVFQQIFSGPF